MQQNRVSRRLIPLDLYEHIAIVQGGGSNDIQLAHPHHAIVRHGTRRDLDGTYGQRFDATKLIDRRNRLIRT
ncbi:hypothetical protein D3C77_609750 [compost metagenome]